MEANEFFLHKKIGSRVEDQKGRILGKITDIQETGANNVYEVSDGSSVFLVPDVPHVVVEINVETKKAATTYFAEGFWNEGRTFVQERQIALDQHKKMRAAWIIF